ncbi:oxygen-independent coproporphyrinogen III oxidase [Parabacteroides pacaensis]|uniref:oxygen-independent coproporphyrinogen III oxidase n=1 Tax=Parabacteroides pacaensis TaxID=2086575 RepID=UPI000D0E449E|nr:oxygen-independent coproporphyrinogen III oxidase [Parabacteroides pacaensis]
MKQEVLEKYNIPVPRYTSYPPANYFQDSFTEENYLQAIDLSNSQQPQHISIYIHIPFCRHLCFYCGCNSYPMMSSGIIESYLKAVQKEIEIVCRRLSPDRKISQIHYGGGSPTAIPVTWLKVFNEQILSYFDCIDNPEIAIECHPGYLDAKAWKELTEAGFTRFSLGVQDFKEDVLKTVNRRASLLPMEEIFAILRNARAGINLDFIYGLPYQTEESFTKTISRAVELNPDRVVTFSYAHVPWVNKRQLKLEEAGLPSQTEKSRMYESAKKLLSSCGYHSIGLDHFVQEEDELKIALQNKMLHRNFQGYCTRRTTGQVYAFGVTAISQLSTAYMQNTKNITTYIEQVDKGILPVAKGYSLSKEEQITREVITSLMCNYSLNWQELAERLKTEVEVIKSATAYNEQILQNFADDHLIEWNREEINMTSEGALFVRNVAASLDKLMLHSNKTFSKPV